MKYNFFIRESRLYYWLIDISPQMRYAMTAFLLLTIAMLWIVVCYIPLCSITSQSAHQMHSAQIELEQLIKAQQKIIHLRSMFQTKEMDWKMQLHLIKENAQRIAFILCALAQQKNVRVERFVPGLKENKAWFETEVVSFDVQGSHENVLQFLHELSMQELFLKIKACTLKLSGEYLSCDLVFDVIVPN